MTKRLHKTLENTKFAKCEVVPVSANPSSASSEASEQADAPKACVGVDALVNKLKEMTFVPKRSSSGPFLFAIDHCFNIKGQGTVMTGTVLSGCVKVNEVSN